MTADAKDRREATSEEPGGRAPAPGDLALVQAFINTNDKEGGSDALGSPERLGAWLAAHHLLEGPRSPSEDEWRRALIVREALRALALANNGTPADEQTIAALNMVVVGLRTRICFGADGMAWLAPAQGSVDAFLMPLLSAVFVAQQNGTWARLKACRSDICQWVYYDQSKNNSSIWCTMAICGSREKMRAYRARRRLSAGLRGPARLNHTDLPSSGDSAMRDPHGGGAQG